MSKLKQNNLENEKEIYANIKKYSLKYVIEVLKIKDPFVVFKNERYIQFLSL